MPQAFLRAALSIDGTIRLVTSQSQYREVLHESMVPKHLLFVLPTEGPAEPAVVNGHGNGNIGDGHRSFSSGASILRY